MSFMNPSAFWGLIGLVIPLAVLLLSKKRQDIVEFGSLAFLEVSESQNAKAIFPTQWLLFFLRALLIAATVIMLAKPKFHKSADEKKVYVEKAVHDDPAFSEKLTDLSESSEITLFTFDVNFADDIRFFPSAWTFIRTLNRDRDSSVVYSYTYQKYFIGTSVPLRPEVSWNIWPHKDQLGKSSEHKIGDKMVELNLQSSESGLNWSIQERETDAESENDTLGVMIIYSRKSKQIADRIKLALVALSDIIPVRFKEVREGQRTDWVISVDTVISRAGSPLIEWNSRSQNTSMTCLTDDYYKVYSDLSSEQLLGSNLPLELGEIFLADELQIGAMDRRVQELEILQNGDENRVLEARTEERKYYWWSFALLMILLERWFASKSKMA